MNVEELAAVSQTRGPVYTSAEKAGSSVKTGKKYHPHCGCTVEVVYGDWKPTEQEQQWIDDYYRAAESLPKGMPRTQETVLPILRRNGGYRDSGERRSRYAKRKAEAEQKHAATLAEALGRRGESMGIEDADRGNANPGYRSGGGGYGRNCQSCVPAYEMRRRGYDVIALPLAEDNSTQMAIQSDTTLTWRNPDTGRHPTLFHMHGRDAGSTERRIAGRIKPGQRYAMQFGWKGRNNGYAVDMETGEARPCTRDEQEEMELRSFYASLVPVPD